MAVDSYTKLLLHGNGADAAINKAITANGNAQLDTAQKKFGSASVLFDGTGDYLSLSDSADWAFGSGDFTVDFWVRRNANGASYWFGQSHTDYSAGSRAWEIEVNAGNLITARVWVAEVSKDASSTGTITADGSWHHVAMVRDGNTLRLFIDGTQDGTRDITGMTVQDSGYPLYIGSLSGLSPINGWIDEFRVSKGIARLTANFTPPAKEYETDSYTKLLIHGNGVDGATAIGDTSGFSDLSASEHPVVCYGNAQLDTAQKKFGSASILFDGTGDYLSVPSSADWTFGTGSFTIDTWVRSATLPTHGDVQFVVSRYYDATNTWSIYLYNNSGTYYWYLQNKADGYGTFDVGKARDRKSVV